MRAERAEAAYNRALFTPFGFAKAWWSADDHGSPLMTDDGAGLISSWTDRVGGIAVTGATTARPTWAATSFNSAYQGVTGDGVANTLVTTTFGNIPTGAVAGRIFLLVHTPLLTATAAPIGYGGSSGATQRKMTFSGTETTAINDGATSGGGTSGDGLGVHVFESRFNDVTMEGFLNSVALADNPITIGALATGTTRLRLFANSATTAAQFYPGVIRHVIITADDMPALLIEKIRGWLAWDGGIQTSLPASHSYRYRRPRL